MSRRNLLATVLVIGCGGGAGLPDAAPGPRDAAPTPPDAAPAPPDAAPAPLGCAGFTMPPSGWVMAPGFSAGVIASADTSPLIASPAGIALAGGPFGDRFFVTNQTSGDLVVLDGVTLQPATFVDHGRWPVAPGGLAGVTWDAQSAFDGALYVADYVSFSDQQSRIYRVDATGAATLHTAAPGPGLNEIYTLDFAPLGSAYLPGLYVTGDTDGALVDWGRFDAGGVGVAFSEVQGGQGAAFDRGGAFGGALWATLAVGGGWAGDGSIRPIAPDGTAGAPLATGLGGPHAPVFAPAGSAFGPALVVANWQQATITAFAPDGSATPIVTGGAQFTATDANVLAFSADGDTLLVAEGGAGRLVCVEKTSP